ncbi:MAG: thiamine-phosphate pyrophosphorylase [Candidatus Omnitrophica bacterium]|nr:thiamine-phosphate pyrophosphorylase [Candidatus Omnitrophota bacterium]
MKKDLYRIIDANLNRSREGLRVCEEIVRFALSSPALTKELKSVRHEVSLIAKTHYKKTGALSCARDSSSDVGRVSRKPSEMRRSSFCDIFTANAQRAKESLRVLEEFYKLTDKKISMRFSHLRFRVYEIERKASGRIEALRNN